MPAVSNLDRIRCPCRHTASILCRTVTGHYLDPWVFFQPGSDCFGCTVWQHIDHSLCFAIGQDGAITATLLKGKVVHTEYTRCGAGCECGGMGASEKGVTTRTHGAAHTLTCAGFPSKSEREVTEFRIKANCPLCGHRHQIGQALSECDCRTRMVSRII